MMKILMSITLVTTFILLFITTALAATLVVADFDLGDKPNNIGGDFGAWNKDESDDSQGCKNSFNSDIKHSTRGYSVQLDYDVDSPRPAYNGFWMELEGQNISKFDKLSLWIKGDDVSGFSKKIKLELKNTKGEVGKYTITNLTKDWQQVNIPLKEFKGLNDLKSMTEFVIVFDDITCAAKKTGTIYIDDIAFVK
ncbi:MAG: carbohydrate binding domain-containing protein [Candidatus Omnitrophota bacterium]